MTLDDWIRAQVTDRSGGRHVGRMTDGDFAGLLADDAGDAPSVQAVQLWRKGQRRPSEAYAARIAAVTGGAVTARDLDDTWQERKKRDAKRVA